ncbi:RhoGAP domain-containing protein [Hamiltosporidium tvaerminnensis]|uniref:RhoGAP domain-containing protein n=1 Tax=Hamiltosporidium tvaerminnensis TaxID=1176355 RepID=A0A4Q9M2M9_9MICR|nr:RhoGAP domain-containing protein [Hamiltosporidium tvaerminnensis]
MISFIIKKANEAFESLTGMKFTKCSRSPFDINTNDENQTNQSEEIIPKKIEYMVPFNVKKSYSFFIKYGNLTRSERIYLSEYCFINLNNISRCISVTKIIFIVKGFFTKRKNFISLKRKINPFVFELIDYLKKDGTDKIGIFRIPGKSNIYNQISKDLGEGKTYHIESYDINTNASILKAYIREILDGLIPIEVCKALFEITNQNDQEKISKVREVLPFIFLEDYRLLIIKIIDLLKTIDSHSCINKMTMSNLLIIFTPTFFPKSVTNSYEILALEGKILEIFTYLDFENISLVLLLEAKKYFELK